MDNAELAKILLFGTFEEDDVELILGSEMDVNEGEIRIINIIYRIP